MVDLGPLNTPAQAIAAELAKIMMVAHERDISVWYMEDGADYQVYDDSTRERLNVRSEFVKGRLTWVVRDAGE